MVEKLQPIYIRPELNNKSEPCLVIRMQINETEVMKELIKYAWRDQPVTVMPQFRDKLKCISKLIDLGVLHRHTDLTGAVNYDFLI